MTKSPTPTQALAPCPPWCRQHTGDEVHYGELYRHTDTHDGIEQELIVRLSRCECECGCAEPLFVTLPDLHPDRPLSVAGAAWLAATLSKVTEQASASTTPSEPAVGASNRWSRGVPSLICESCSSEFHPDSSPRFDLCWQCDEGAGR